MGRVVVLKEMGTDRVASLVVGSEPLFVGRHYAAAPLGPGDHPVNRLLEFGHTGHFLFSAHRQQGGLVYQICQISPHHARCHTSQNG